MQHKVIKQSIESIKKEKKRKKELFSNKFNFIRLFV